MSFIRVCKYFTISTLATFLVCCNDIEESSDIAFVKFFGEGEKDYGVDICVQGETIYVLGDYEKSNNFSPCLYFFNSQGEYSDKPWVIGDTLSNEKSQKLLTDSNGNLYIISNKVINEDKETIYVRKINNKSIEWENSFGDGLRSVGASDAIISNNDITIIGNAKIDIVNVNDTTIVQNAYFLKIDLDGNFIDHEDIGGVENNDEASNLLKLDEDYYFTGYTLSYSINGNRNIWITKLNNLGGVIAGPKVFSSGRADEGFKLDVNGKTLILASNEEKSLGGNKVLRVYGINSKDLIINWETEITENRNVVPKKILLSNNNIIILSSKFSNTRGVIGIHYLDLEGNYLSQKELGSNQTLLQVNSSILHEDELILVGSNENNQNSDIALIKLKMNNVLSE